MCSICQPDLKICVLYCFFYTFGYFLLYSSPCVSTCEVLGNYMSFFFVCSSGERFLGQCPHYLSGQASMIKNRCSQLLAWPVSSACIKWKAGLSFLGDLALLLNSLMLENFPKYWQGSGFVADQWSHILPWPPQTLQLWGRRFWCGSTGVLSFM